MIKRYFGITPYILAGISLVACVTINIYFPAAAAEKVADKIIEEVWHIDEKVDSDEEADKAKSD